MSDMKIFLLVATLLFTSVASTANIVTEKNIYRTARVEMSLYEKHKWSVVITQQRKRLSKSEFESVIDSSYPFGIGSIEDFYIRQIQFKRDSIPIRTLALSAFSDLFNPAKVRLQNKGSNMLLIIEGGDAAFSYIAELEIAPYGVLVRNVKNRISGYEEITHYRYPDSYVRSFD
jgi:hypothetical protein